MGVIVFLGLIMIAAIFYVMYGEPQESKGGYLLVMSLVVIVTAVCVFRLARWAHGTSESDPDPM